MAVFCRGGAVRPCRPWRCYTNQPVGATVLALLLFVAGRQRKARILPAGLLAGHVHEVDHVVANCDAGLSRTTQHRMSQLRSDDNTHIKGLLRYSLCSPYLNVGGQALVVERSPELHIDRARVVLRDKVIALYLLCGSADSFLAPARGARHNTANLA